MRAPAGYRTINGKVYHNPPPKPATVCSYSGHPVTQTQRKRKVRDCPKCGAPDIPWIEPAGQDWAEVGSMHRYLTVATWGKHAPGIGTVPTLFTLEEGDTNDALPTDEESDTPPF